MIYIIPRAPKEKQNFQPIYELRSELKAPDTNIRYNGTCSSRVTKKWMNMVKMGTIKQQLWDFGTSLHVYRLKFWNTQRWVQQNRRKKWTLYNIKHWPKIRDSLVEFKSEEYTRYANERSTAAFQKRITNGKSVVRYALVIWTVFLSMPLQFYERISSKTWKKRKVEQRLPEM